jgi:RNA polymerase sigma-70 factor (ECF subfamily)
MLASRTVERTVTAGDDALEGLLARHLDASYRLAAVILDDPIEAEDAVHDAAAAAWRGRSRLRDPGAFEAWFTRIVVNQCRDRLRVRRRRHVLDVRPAPTAPPDRAAPDTSELNANRAALAGALAVLEPDEQIVVVLRFWRDLTVEQIAERVGVPSGTVKSRLHHALGRLRSALTVEEVDR